MTADAQPTPPPVTVDDIAHAERLAGISFTDEEREFMLASVAKKLEQYKQIHAYPLQNSSVPALTFDPRPMRHRPAVQNTIRHYSVSPQTVTRPDNLEDVAFYTVAQLEHLIQTRQVTSVELTEMYLARLERYNEKLQCVISFTRERALAQARRLDEEAALGLFRSPLHGIPWGAKDLLAVRGYRTTWGAAPFQEQVFDFDATVVERLDAAGAVLIAKLSLGELASGDRWFGGNTVNPWNLDEPSGGSSAGSSAATSAGLVGFAIGSETGGSIVWPAGRCGVTGLRPTFGLVPATGAMTLSWTLDKIGPIARSAEDCALIMTAIYGPNGRDTFAIDVPFAWSPNTDVRGLRVGYVPSAFETPNYDSPEYADTVALLRKNDIVLRNDAANHQATLALLESLGVTLVPVELPDFPMDALRMIMSIEAGAAFDELTRSNQDDLLRWQGEDSWANRLRGARLIPAVEYVQANRVRTLLIEAMADLMETVDVLVLPPLAGGNMMLGNLTGQPGLSVPNGLAPEGMPTSIHLLGRPFEDATLLSLAHAMQNASDHHRQHPPMAWA